MTSCHKSAHIFLLFSPRERTIECVCVSVLVCMCLCVSVYVCVCVCVFAQACVCSLFSLISLDWQQQPTGRNKFRILEKKWRKKYIKTKIWSAYFRLIWTLLFFLILLGQFIRYIFVLYLFWKGIAEANIKDFWIIHM